MEKNKGILKVDMKLKKQAKLRTLPLARTLIPSKLRVLPLARTLIPSELRSKRPKRAWTLATRLEHRRIRSKKK